MTLKFNPAVTRLHAYLPFGAGHGQLYEEHIEVEGAPALPTVAIDRLVALVREETPFIVLTGDAGHGKTHMCRRLLQEALSCTASEAHDLICTRGDGEQVVGRVQGRPLKIVRDLSDFEERGSELLRQGLMDDESTIVVCANEGRLRASLAGHGDLTAIRDALEAATQRGRCLGEDGIAVLDLNAQSVTVGAETSLLSKFLGWCVDGRKWRVCNECEAKDLCPIRFNRDRFAPDASDSSERVRGGLHTLLQVVELGGGTITIRDLIILVAFAVTGGLDCKAVHGAHARHRGDDKAGWQHPFLFFNCIFDPRLAEDQVQSAPLLGRLRVFDPGRVAIRPIDEAIAVVEESESIPFLLRRPRAGLGAPRTTREAKIESEGHERRFISLRRRDFFEEFSAANAGGSLSRAERLGLRHHELFLSSLSSPDDVKHEAIRKKVLQGLEAVQDVRRPAGRPKFVVVDPAFANITGGASVLSRVIPAKSVRLIARSEYLTTLLGSPPDMPESVDWLEKQLVVHFEGEALGLDLNLLQFEFVVRSAEGLSSRRFHQATIRRLLGMLAVLAKKGDQEKDGIQIVYGDKPREITVDDINHFNCE